jgi:hypothetical protein
MWRLLVLIPAALGATFPFFLLVSSGVFGVMAVTIAIAVPAFIGMRRGDQKAQVNAIITHSLMEVQNWWTTLTDAERAERKNIDRLVSETEEAISIERREYDYLLKSQRQQQEQAKQTA